MLGTGKSNSLEPHTRAGISARRSRTRQVVRLRQGHPGRHPKRGDMTAPAGSRPSGRCPFRLLSWPANHSSPAEGSDAPIGAPATAAKSGGGCPFRPFLAGAAPPARDTSGAEDSGAPAPERACPLGFGTPSRPQLDGEAINDALHCPLCRGLYHDAVRLKCGHWACDFCARQPSGGCGKCGEPVAIMGTDNRIQGAYTTPPPPPFQPVFPPVPQHLAKTRHCTGVCTRYGAQRNVELCGCTVDVWRRH